MEIHLKLQHILILAPVHKAQILRDDLIENKAAHRGLNHAGFHRIFIHFLLHAHLYPRMQRHDAVLIRQNRLIHALKGHALSLCSRPLLGQVVDAKHHILGGNRHRAAVGGL